MRATVGSVLVGNGLEKRIYTDSFAQNLGSGGFNDLRVIAIGKNGEAISSESYTMEFAAGTLTKTSESDAISGYPETIPNNSWNSRLIFVLDQIMDRIFTMFDDLFDKFAVQ